MILPLPVKNRRTAAELISTGSDLGAAPASNGQLAQREGPGMSLGWTASKCPPFVVVARQPSRAAKRKNSRVISLYSVPRTACHVIRRFAEIAERKPADECRVKVKVPQGPGISF